jgi:diacylglycerol kinase family enzyme
VSAATGPALIVLGLGASGLHDPAARDRLALAAADAARRRGHRDATVVACPDAAALRTTVVAAVSDGVGLVVAIGGDGTVREAAGGVAGSGTALAIVPAGTGNLLAAALAVPGDVAGAMTTIATGSVRRMDVGRASWGVVGGTDEGRGRSPFVVACGAGLDARFVEAASGEAKRRFGIGAYLGAALAQITDLRPRPTQVVVDGEAVETESVVVLVANAGELIPGVLGPRLPVRPDDGWLHVFVVRGGLVGSLVGALELLAAASPGPTSTRSGQRWLARAVSVRVDVEPPEPIQVDGDRVGEGSLEATIEPGAVQVVVPRRPASG